MNATAPDDRGAQPGNLTPAIPPNSPSRETSPLGSRPLTVQEAATFLRGTTGAPTEYAVVERLALLAGLRPNEIADLARNGHVERHGSRWHITLTGGKGPRTIAVAQLVGEALQALADERLHQQGPLQCSLPRFAALNRVVDHLHAALEDSGFDDASVHSIRGFLLEHLPKVAGADRAHAYLGVVGVANVDSQVLPEGWDTEVAELIDQHFGVLAAS